MNESWKSANARRACMICGASGSATFLLDDHRLVRACDECLRKWDSDAENWAYGDEITDAVLLDKMFGKKTEAAAPLPDRPVPGEE